MCRDCGHFEPTALDWGKCYWKGSLGLKRDTPATVHAGGEQCIEHQVASGMFGKGVAR